VGDDFIYKVYLRREKKKRKKGKKRKKHPKHHPTITQLYKTQQRL
jgi:hypothetical protein